MIEILIVLVIMGLSMGLVMLNTSQKKQKQQPEFIAFLQHQQQYAIQQRKLNHIQRRNGFIYATASQQKFPLPPEQHLTAEHYLPYQTLTTFYPDGTIHLSEFTIKIDSNEYDIKTSPFNNKISYTQHPKS